MFNDEQIEDLWIPFFCVSANLTRAELVVHEIGPLWDAVRASTTTLGIFTLIVYRGDVLVDGGVMNNFPVNLMRERVGTGTVISSNAYARGSKDETYSFGPGVSGWKALLQRKSNEQTRPNWERPLLGSQRNPPVALAVCALTRDQLSQHWLLKEMDLLSLPRKSPCTLKIL